MKMFSSYSMASSSSTLDIPFYRLKLSRGILQLALLDWGLGREGKCAFLAVKVTGVTLIDEVIHSTAALSAKAGVTTGSIPTTQSG